MTSVTLNTNQQHFLINHGNSSFSTTGFDYVFRRLQQYASILGLNPPSKEAYGTLEQYDAYKKAETAYIQTRPEKTLYDPGTPAQVQRVLEKYRQNGKTVRVFYGDSETGRDWLEESDVVGRIGRSVGPIKIPLLLGKGASGGPAILTAFIVRILDGKSGVEQYRHPKYQEPLFEIKQNPSEAPGRTGVFTKDGPLHATFGSLEAAQNWVSFMQGRRTKP